MLNIYIYKFDFSTNQFFLDLLIDYNSEKDKLYLKKICEYDSVCGAY